MKKVGKNIKDCAVGFSTCIEWSGPNLACLGIQTGDCLDAVIYTIAEKVCQLAEPLDLSTVTIQCIIDRLDLSEPASLTLANLLQLLVDGECRLQDQIDNILDSLSTGGTPLTLDLKCIAQYDSFGNILPYDEQSVLQGLINEFCSLKQTVTELSGKVTNLENQLEDLEVPTYVEPTITSCLFPTGRPVSQATQILADSYCSYQDVIGLIPSIQQAMGLQSAEFNTYYQTFPGWNITVTTASEMWQNMQIVLADMFSRIRNIETNCCALDCDDIKIGFGVAFENSSIVLLFTNQYGTKIPNDFEDCGSTFTITDESGYVVSGDIELTNNFTSDEISLLGLTRGQMLTISINTKMCSEGQTCQQCITKLVKYETDCCIVTNTGSADVYIIYKITTN